MKFQAMAGISGLSILPVISAFLRVNGQTLGCPSGWQRFEDSCYRHFQVKSQLTTAYTTCGILSAHLVSILSASEEAFIRNSVLGGVTGPTTSWTGLSKGLLHSGGELTCSGLFRPLFDDYIWSDFSPVDYLNWTEGEPNPDTSEICVSISRESGLDAVDCNARMGYICKRKIQGKQFCEFSSHFGWKCFKLFGDSEVSQEDAATDCRRRGGTLVSFHSEFEKRIISDFYAAFWIGLQEAGVHGQYQWIDKSEVNYLNWGQGEPSDVNETNNCILQRYETKWSELKCTERHPYACQFADCVVNGSVYRITEEFQGPDGTTCRCVDEKTVACKKLPCSQCPERTCDSSPCKTGYVTDENGCQTCQCKDPKCEGVTCEDGCTCMDGFCCPNSVLSETCEDPCAHDICGFFKVCKRYCNCYAKCVRRFPCQSKPDRRHRGLKRRAGLKRRGGWKRLGGWKRRGGWKGRGDWKRRGGEKRSRGRKRRGGHRRRGGHKRRGGLKRRRHGRE